MSGAGDYVFENVQEPLIPVLVISIGALKYFDDYEAFRNSAQDG